MHSNARQIRRSAACAAFSLASPALAEAPVLTPLQDIRLRYEHVDQDGIARQADAVTLRARGGIGVAMGRLSALVEAQGNLAIVDRYDDNVSGPSPYPAVGDPENIALYRAQLQYEGGGLTVTGGRQRITLDDERFVGAANFRQNARTYDAVRVRWAPARSLKADVTYSRSVRNTSGINGNGSKPTAIDGDNVFVNVSHDSPIGQVTAFAYLIDQDERAVQGYRLSNQTYGGRIAGGRTLSPALKVKWQLSAARQSDYHRNPNDYAATYYLADLAVEGKGLRLGAGVEQLGASGGAPFTSFQTPLAAIFKFQGWADKLTTTPANGLRDLYGSAGWTWKTVGPFKAVLVQAVAHRFTSDRLDQHYGNEIDLLASAKFGRYAISARYADYRADRLATDTRKLWLEASWAL